MHAALLSRNSIFENTVALVDPKCHAADSIQAPDVHIINNATAVTGTTLRLGPGLAGET